MVGAGGDVYLGGRVVIVLHRIPLASCHASPHTLHGQPDRPPSSKTRSTCASVSSILPSKARIETALHGLALDGDADGASADESGTGQFLSPSTLLLWACSRPNQSARLVCTIYLQLCIRACKASAS